jgi:hypothetical protein
MRCDEEIGSFLRNLEHNDRRIVGWRGERERVLSPTKLHLSLSYSAQMEMETIKEREKIFRL